uniref:RUS1 family protein C16orf58 homolog isoform X1 n=1 Tax=Crassostrea virginica TaxID=6565 RepID=A0A8B8EYA2_CRAVI|nr:RUS1 family protein C16orf58 homolog isoform X1 [Crassostrea virginica]
MVCKEVYGSSSVCKKYVKKEKDTLSTIDLSPKWTSISQFFTVVFLPQGYPESVSSDYLQYQIWDTIQAFASSITGTLAAQAMLKGVGVGDESATVMAATLTWILKDGTGMIGRILFAWIQGSNLDCDAKRWRLFADILNDLAICMEILAPYFKAYFTLIVCTAGVCKSIVGVAGGATRAALTQHQARRNNMADVSAKDGSQETLVNLAALICSLTLVPLVTGKDMLIWTLFLLFTVLHLVANYSAVSSVVMETLNQARLHILVREYLHSGRVLSLQEVNQREPVLWRTRKKLSVHLGTSIGKVFSKASVLEELISTYKDSNYLLDVNLRTGRISIMLHLTSTSLDHLQSCIQAEVISFVYDNMYKNTQVLHEDLRDILLALQAGDTLEASAASLQYTAMRVDEFCQALITQGWSCDPLLLGPDEWRAEWESRGTTHKKEI